MELLLVQPSRCPTPSSKMRTLLLSLAAKTALVGLPLRVAVLTTDLPSASLARSTWLIKLVAGWQITT